nr:RNA-directed DNA polymerase, eukaryota [Tanacetum cinerariifolium]
MDAYRDEGMGDVIFGEPFLRKVRINARWFEGMITIYNGNDEVTYQMVRSHPRFKHHTNEGCNKIPPLLKDPITFEMRRQKNGPHTGKLACMRWNGKKAHLLEDKQIPSVGVFNEDFNTWMDFEGNTRDLGSFGEETDKITDLHQISCTFMHTVAEDGVAGIKRRRRGLYRDGVRNFTTAPRHGLKQDLESSTWRWRKSNEDILINHKKLHDITPIDSLEVAQKAKVRWAIKGDENTKYFHGILNNKRSQLAIRGVLVDGDWFVNPSVVKDDLMHKLESVARQRKRYTYYCLNV